MASFFRRTSRFTNTLSTTRIGGNQLPFPGVSNFRVRAPPPPEYQNAASDGFLFGEVPPADGQKRKRAKWEYLFFLFIGVTAYIPYSEGQATKFYEDEAAWRYFQMKMNPELGHPIKYITAQEAFEKGIEINCLAAEKKATEHFKTLQHQQ